MSRDSFFNNKLQIISFKSATQREYKEEPNPDQSPFDIDLTRITMAHANRLLAEKTQVHLTLRSGKDTLWSFRTRASHTEEVIIIARRIAKTMELNVELAGVISRVHDQGHSPFGHSGEIVIKEILKKFNIGFFNHDRQALRVVTKLEIIRPSFKGLNLTSQVRTDLESRARRHEKDKDLLQTKHYPQGSMSLESQVTEFADKLAFIISDLEDFIRLRLFSLEELNEAPVLPKLITKIKQELSAEDYQRLNISLAYFKKEVYNYFLASIYQNCQDLLKYTGSIKSKKGTDPRIIFTTTTKIIICESSVQEEFETLLNWMYENLYGKLMKERDLKTRYTIEFLFDLLYHNEELRNIYNQLKIEYDSQEHLAQHIADLIVMSGESWIAKFFSEHILAS